MPYPWEISRGKPQTIPGLIEEEHAFYRSRIRRGEHDAEPGTTDLDVTAESMASEATIAPPEVDLDRWTASMAQDSDAARVTYAIPFRGDQQIVRLAIDWKSGGHAVEVLPGEIQFSIWSRDKDAATIRAEAGTVLLAIGQQWRDAMALLASWNAGVRGELRGDLAERQRFTGERDALLHDLNRRESGGSSYQTAEPPTQAEVQTPASMPVRA